MSYKFHQGLQVNWLVRLEMLTLVDSVDVDSPHVVNALMNVAIVIVLTCDCGGNEPEKHVLNLQLIDGYKKS